MPKISVENRNENRKQTVAKFEEKRQALKAIISSPNSSDEERWEAVIQLQKQPRDASRSRVRNRCKLCSRPRSYNRLTGLCRLHMRPNVLAGYVPGMRKSSW